MTPELQAYYDNRFSTMATQGWQDLVDDATEMFKAVNNLSPVVNEQDLYYRKGQLDILQWLLSLRDSSAAAYEQLSSGDVTDGS
jgi:hypothetical protein